MIKAFRFDTYDGRNVVICGPLVRSLPVLKVFAAHPEISLYYCYDSRKTYPWELLFKAFLQKMNPEMQEYFHALYGELRRFNVTVIGPSALENYRNDYWILTGCEFYRKYAEITGENGLSGFYSPVAVLPDAFMKEAYAESMFPLLFSQKEGCYLSGVELMLTTRCTLRCRDCANLIPYHHAEQVVGERVLAGVKALLEAVDGIGMLKILGGEPLLAQPLLVEILDLLKLERYQKILVMRIITNGTVLLEKETLDALAECPFATVYISDYGMYSNQTSQLIQQMEEQKIPYTRNGDNLIWRDFGDPVQNNGTSTEIKLRHQSCQLKEKCLTLLNGFLYHCPRAANGEAIGFYKGGPSERVDLLDNTVPADALKKNIQSWYHAEEPICACSFCTGGNGQVIEKAIQIE